MKEANLAAISAACVLLDHSKARLDALDAALADIGGLLEAIDQLAENPVLVSHLARIGRAFAETLTAQPARDADYNGAVLGLRVVTLEEYRHE